MKFSRADNRVNMWKFSDVSATNSVFIFRVCWVLGRTRNGSGFTKHPAHSEEGEGFSRETSENHILTQLSVLENLFELCHSESCKTYNFLFTYLYFGCLVKQFQGLKWKHLLNQLLCDRRTNVDFHVPVHHNTICENDQLYAAVLDNLLFLYCSLAIGLHLGFFRPWPSLYLPSSFSSVWHYSTFVLNIRKWPTRCNCVG